MEIHYVLSDYPTLLENMVAKVYEANAPTVEIQSIVIPTPHNAPVNVTFTGLDNIPHILRLYTASGTKLQEFNVQPTANVVTVYDPIFFKIGDGGVNTPAVNDTTYVNTALAGLTNTDVILHRNGGAQFPGIHYNVNLLGGFALAQVGDIMQADEEFILERKPQNINNPVNDSVVGKQWGPTTGNANMFVDVANVTVGYLASHLRKLIRLSGNSGVYNFNAAVPIGYPFRFSNQVSGTATINFTTAPLITGAGDVTTYSLTAGQILEVVYDGTKFNKTMENLVPVMPNLVSTYGTLLINEIFGGRQINVIIPDQGTTNYIIVGSFRSIDASNLFNDCTGIWSVGPVKTATQWTLNIREFVGVYQHLYFDYAIIKTV